MSGAPMTSRERVLASVEHREPDHLAVDLGSTPSSGISAVAYANLVQHLGLADQRTRVYDVVQQLAQPSDELLDRLRIDVVDIGRTFDAADDDWRPMTLPDRRRGRGARPGSTRSNRPTAPGTPTRADGVRIASMPLGASFFDQTVFPYVDGYPDDLPALSEVMPLVLWSGLVHSPWDHASRTGLLGDAARTDAGPARDDRSGAHGRRGLQPVRVGHVPAAHRQLPDGPRGRPGQRGAAARRAHGHSTSRRSRRCCAAVGDVVDVIRFGDDLGTDGGPLMSPETYRPVFKPRQHAARRTTSTSTAQHEDVPALVRLDLPAAAGPHRGRLRHHQPGADHGPGHGAASGSSASSARTSPSGAAARTRAASCRGARRPR